MRQASWLIVLLTLTLPVRADPPAENVAGTQVTLQDYIHRAIEQGIRGRETALSLESAGYTRQIAFRQTDSPTLTLDYTKTRSGTESDGATTSLSDTDQSRLTLNQTIPLGTVISGSVKYNELNRPGYTASATQPVYLFVKNAVGRTRRRASIAYENAKDTYQSAVLTIRNQARGFYYDVMLNEESIKVEKRKVQASRALNDVTVALVQAGKLAPVESMRSKIRLQADERRLANAEVNYQKSVLNAKNFIYLPLDEPVHFMSKLEFKPFGVPPDRLIQYALVHRQDVTILRRNKELALLDAQAALEPGRPSLSLNSSYDYSDANDLITKNWTVGGTASWLFFDSFVTHDQASIARIAQHVADLNLAEAERAVRLDVQNAYLDVKNAEQQIRDFTFSRDQSHRNVEVLRLRFQNGLDRLIDVFDAENDARSLDFEYLNLLINFNRTKDTLALLIGLVEGEVDAL